jgi:chitodextrinase
VRTSLVPLFQAGHVNLVLSGDSHNYQRSKPLNASGNPVTSGGITYIVTGGGGNGLAQFTGGAMPSWQAFREASTYESLKIQVSATGLTVQAISATDGSVIDSTTLGTSTPPPPDTTAPTTPTGLTGTPADTSVALSWTASTDNVGVAHYNVYRNGTQIAGAAPTGTTYTDTGLTPGTAYSYTVSASDAAGNTSGQSAAFATTTTTTGGGGGTTVTVTPTNDSTIDPVTTDSISSTRLKADASAPKNDLLMKFTVPSTCATVTAASLTLTVGSASTDPSVRGGDFYATSPGDTNAGWSESSVVWASAPVATGSPVSLAGAVAANTAYTVNATSIVQAAGGTGAGTTFTLRGSNTSGDGAGYYSKEGSTTSGPQLILTCG